jgi:hypothetical protein
MENQDYGELEADVEKWQDNYQGDFSTLDVEKLFDAKGLWIKPSGFDQWAVQCPWCADHTTGDSGSSFKRYERGRCSFWCSHSHCNDKRTEQLFAFFGPHLIDLCCEKPDKDRELLSSRAIADTYFGLTNVEIENAITIIEKTNKDNYQRVQVEDIVSDELSDGEKVETFEPEADEDSDPELRQRSEKESKEQQSEQRSESSENKQKPERKKALTIADLDNLPPPKWLIAGHLEEMSIGCGYGSYESFKSFAVLDMALCVATGKLFLDKHPVVKGPVVYVAPEGYTGLRKRIKAWLRYHKQETPTNFIIMPDSYDMTNTKTPALLLEIIVQELGEMPALIVFDTLARNFGAGDENSTRDMNTFVNNVTELRNLSQAAVLIVHHTGKDAQRGARGSVAFNAACDSMIEFVRDKATMSVLVHCHKLKEETHFEDYILEASIFDLPDIQSNSLVLNYAEHPTKRDLREHNERIALRDRMFEFGEYLEQHNQAHKDGQGELLGQTELITKFGEVYQKATGQHAGRRRTVDAIKQLITLEAIGINKDEGAGKYLINSLGWRQLIYNYGAEHGLPLYRPDDCY